MTTNSQPIAGDHVVKAKAVLWRMQARKQLRTERMRERIGHMLAGLDTILSRLTEDTSEHDLAEVEKIVVALHTADCSITSGALPSALQSIDLARARIERLRDSLPEKPLEPTSESATIHRP